MGEGPWKWEEEYKDRHRIGDLGVYVGMVPVFQDWWFHHRQGGFEQTFSDFIDEPELMGEIHEYWMEWALAYTRAMVKARPDEIMLGASSASLSVSSPDIFRRYELPFIKKASQNLQGRRHTFAPPYLRKVLEACGDRRRAKPTWMSWSRWRSRRGEMWT